MKRTILLICLFYILFFTTFVDAASCFPEYRCGSWSSCIDDFQTRICEDQKCERRNLTERKLCTEIPDCDPKIKCSSWSSCIYTERINDILEGKVSAGGYKERICSDLTGCVESFLEESICDEFYNASLVKIEEDRTFLVTVDSMTNQPVAKINLDSWKSNKLDIIFIQSTAVYPTSCYNVIKDVNEEKIDCGGPCKQCRQASIFALSNLFLMVVSWLFSAFFIFLWVIELSLIKKS
jgi:hypothetical protein